MAEKINKEYLKEKQYKSTKYLEARIKIHQFTENEISFHEWIFEQYKLDNLKNKKINILDVGCGTGIFWKKNINKIENIDLTITDFSDAMIEKSIQNLNDYKNDIKFEVAEIEKLEKYYGKFDMVLCHNVIYHSEDKNLAIENLARCLNDNEESFLSITTNSEKHMLNVYEIGRQLDENFPTDRIIDSFTEEVADKLLPNHVLFEKIVENEKLKVTDLDILMDYVASGVEPRNIKLVEDFYDKYKDIAKKEIEEKGHFEIIKRSPLYICKQKK